MNERVENRGPYDTSWRNDYPQNRWSYGREDQSFFDSFRSGAGRELRYQGRRAGENFVRSIFEPPAPGNDRERGYSGGSRGYSGGNGAPSIEPWRVDTTSSDGRLIVNSNFRLQNPSAEQEIAVALEAQRVSRQIGTPDASLGQIPRYIDANYTVSGFSGDQDPEEVAQFLAVRLERITNPERAVAYANEIQRAFGPEMARRVLAEIDEEHQVRFVQPLTGALPPAPTAGAGITYAAAPANGTGSTAPSPEAIAAANAQLNTWKTAIDALPDSTDRNANGAQIATILGLDPTGLSATTATNTSAANALGARSVEIVRMLSTADQATRDAFYASLEQNGGDFIADELRREADAQIAARNAGAAAGTPGGNNFLSMFNGPSLAVLQSITITPAEANTAYQSLITEQDTMQRGMGPLGPFVMGIMRMFGLVQDPRELISEAITRDPNSVTASTADGATLLNQVGGVVRRGNPSLTIPNYTANGAPAADGAAAGTQTQPDPAAIINATNELAEEGRNVGVGQKPWTDMKTLLTGMTGSAGITAESSEANVRGAISLTRKALEGLGFPAAEIGSDAEMYALLNGNENLRNAVNRVFTTAGAAGPNRVTVDATTTPAEEAQILRVARAQNAAPPATTVPAPAVQPVDVNATGNPAATEALTGATLSGTARATVGALATQVQSVTGISGETGFGAKTEQAIVIAAMASGNAALAAAAADGNITKEELQTLFSSANSADMLRALQAVRAERTLNLGDTVANAAEINAVATRVTAARAAEGGRGAPG